MIYGKGGHTTSPDRNIAQRQIVGPNHQSFRDVVQSITRDIGQRQRGRDRNYGSSPRSSLDDILKKVTG